MPNIAALLKSEIARIARKEVKQQTEALRRATAGYRREIAELKRKVQALEASHRSLYKRIPDVAGASEPSAGDTDIRFNAKGFASLRKRLGLSAADLGLLIGPSGLSVYKWEQGKVRPRAKYLVAIANIRGIGKREAEARLKELR